MATPGRRREDAPPGHATVREAADALGITRQAVRQRIERGTLPTADFDITEGGERRYYIPLEALERAVEEKNLPATKDDTGAVKLHQEALTEAVLAEIKKNREERRLQHLQHSELMKMIADAVNQLQSENSARLDKITANQEGIRDEVVRFMDADRRYQERIIEMMEQRQVDYTPWMWVTAGIVLLLLLLVVLVGLLLTHV